MENNCVGATRFFPIWKKTCGWFGSGLKCCDAPKVLVARLKVSHTHTPRIRYSHQIIFLRAVGTRARACRKSVGRVSVPLHKSCLDVFLITARCGSPKFHSAVDELFVT